MKTGAPRCRVSVHNAWTCRVCEDLLRLLVARGERCRQPFNDKGNASLWRVPSSNSNRPGSGLALLFSVEQHQA
ncbi:MAG: hypothetical protein KGL35_32260 [Bradyrhizobium sp.]|nr:hypothetical protein [Bradyrhizobium sp.]